MSHTSTLTGEVQALVKDLRADFRGEVRFDDGSRALYATDGSNYRQVPIGVLIPEDKEDAAVAVQICSRYAVPLLSRGCGTSLAGQCCNVAVVLDFSKRMNHLLELDPERRVARVQPGLILDHLRDAAEQHHLTFAPDPSTHSRCTLGGMIGNNSCGVHSIMAGRTADNVESLEVITYEGLRLTVGPTSDDELARLIEHGGPRGELYHRLRDFRDRYADEIRTRYPDIPRRVSGYNLDELLPERGFQLARALVGSESTLVTVLEATVDLVHSPPARSLLVLGYPSVYEAGYHVPEILTFGPTGLEGIDDLLIRYMKQKGLHPEDVNLLPEGKGWLMVEFGGDTKQESDARAQELMDALKRTDHAPSMKLFDDPGEEKLLWEVREAGLAATAHVPGMPYAWPGWEDSSVPPDKVGDYLQDFRKLLDRYEYQCSLYGHFGQGCIHCRITFDLFTAEGVEHFRHFLDDAARLVTSYGGSLSGEHGDGQARAAMLPIMFGDTIVNAFGEFKGLFDPRGKMNPGKVVDPYSPIDNLRLGPDYHPWEPKTHFDFSDDEGKFSEAMLRCVGVGMCRRTDGGTMCPSFMATREEEHSTRGRARLLFELLRGEVIGKQGWKDDAVRDALDLCLACKGCKGDCPVHVDMATYKAEFLSHYYEGRLRPLTGYTMGHIYWWARAAALAPGLVNFVGHAPLLGALSKWAAGVAPERELPRFAKPTFRHWFRHREPRNPGGPKVLLWPDTFNNSFFPDTAIAAVEVLEAAGYRVTIPQAMLCCGRPLYDWGFLDKAKRLLGQILDALEPEIAAGTPLIGLEPSCLAVFRDELCGLYRKDERAHRLSEQSYLLSEFLADHAEGYRPPKLSAHALLHGHCHHKAIMKLDAEEHLLRDMGLSWDEPVSGCCGMAGAFGFERGEHYDVSIRCGERVLLPAVREADRDTLIIADGFSCREQIRQTTGRQPLHLAELLRLALHEEQLAARGQARRPAVPAGR